MPLITRQELTTKKKKKLRVGQRIQLEVASNVTSNGVTIIPVGSPAVGEITEVRNKGMWGKSGYIGARVLSVRADDRNIRLSGTFDDKGVTGTGGVVAGAALMLFRKHGRDAPLKVAERIGALALEGDDLGITVWKDIAWRLDELAKGEGSS